MIGRASLTGFDRIEYELANSYAQREDGWPVGPQLNDRAYSCPSPTVQIIPQPKTKGARRYVVLTLFPFLFTDRRYPPSPLLTLQQARRFAVARLWALATPGQVRFGRGPGIDLARGGHHIGLDAAS